MELLNKIVEEIEIILDVGCVEKFVLDGLYTSLRAIEGITSMTKSMDISGLSDSLRKDVHFNALVRRLYIKYGSYSQVSIEYQAAFIVIMTSPVMIQQNKQHKSLNSFLDQPMSIPVNVSL